MQILLLGYKIKNAVQKSTPPEAKIFRNFHSQMQFSLNKLHFPDEKSANFPPAPSAPAKVPPQPRFGGGQIGILAYGGWPPKRGGGDFFEKWPNFSVWGTIFLSLGVFLPAPVKSWRFFLLENEVYLVKIAFASENLEKFSPPAGYFFVQHLWFCTITIGE